MPQVEHNKESAQVQDWKTALKGNHGRKGADR